MLSACYIKPHPLLPYCNPGLTRVRGQPKAYPSPGVNPRFAGHTCVYSMYMYTESSP